jgi:AraC family transcriptional regulator of adaptative response / DNA-3-methyladenine glycosylase II
MDLTDRDCYRALEARDARFDGRFFVCVASTRVYCRPVCAARTPVFERCRFVPTAAAAEAAGYRPCLRCRPETAPGSPAWRGTAATVQRALRLITDSAGEELMAERLAERLGISSRHMRRLFLDQLGASPKAIASAQRFAVARQLLRQTRLPISHVALAAGFGSVRRFNDAAKGALGVTPSEYRAHGSRGRRPAADTDFRLSLCYRPPFAWQELLEYFRTRAVAGLERVSDGTYFRAIEINGVRGLMSARADRDHDRIECRFSLARPVILTGAVQRIRDLFDLDAAPAEVDRLLGSDPLLAPIVAQTPGLRIPGAWSPFEMTVRAIVGQQVSVKSATTVLGRLVARFGKALDGNEQATPFGTPTQTFPEPAALAGRDLSGVGLTRTRARTLETVAAAFASDPDFVHGAMPPGQARERLLAIRGVGPWTADYVSLRALRNPDAFPAADLGLLKASGAPSASALGARAEAWRPWRGYAVVYLWKSLV